MEDDLLRAMGHETANVHVVLGNVWQDLDVRNNKDPEWLHNYAVKMADTIVEEWAMIYEPSP